MSKVVKYGENNFEKCLKIFLKGGKNLFIVNHKLLLKIREKKIENVSFS